MKRSFLILLGIGIALSLFTTPALAGNTEEATAVASKPDSLDFLFDYEKQICTAEQDCPYDQPISCVGNSYCQVRQFAVVCDGNWTYCQCAAAAPWCYDKMCYCMCKEDGGSDSACRLECCKEPMPWPPDP